MLAIVFAMLSDLDLSKVTQGWGEAQKNLSVDGHPLSIGGVKYKTGLGTHAASKFSIRLNKAVGFFATVGVDDEVQNRGSVEFVVIGDNKKLWSSGIMRGGQPGKRVEVKLEGVKELRLEVRDGGDDINYDHADWAEAKIAIEKGAKKPIAWATPKEPTMPIAMKTSGIVQFHGPSVMGGTPGRDFVFRVPVTGLGSKVLKTNGLPKGLALSGTVISGKLPPAAGIFKFSAFVGRVSREYTLICGDHKLAKTPPMGWNSWNVWGLDVTAKHVKEAADAFVKLGLADYGYQFVNIDDGWEAGRSPSGEILLNQKFGDMKGLSNSVHTQGLKLGIYSSPGPTTCGGYTASYQHESQDAKTYANWGIDYLKYDWCSYGNIAKGNSLEELQKPYHLMRRSLDESGRDIVYSLCQYGMGEVWKWGNEVGGDCWRTTGDITDNWGSMSSIGFAQNTASPFARPSGWNDPDMLVVGKLGWSKNLHNSRLTGNEQITHISLWAMLAAPLLIGCDLTQVDAFTKALLCNHDIIDIDQDSLGKAAVPVLKKDGWQVWTRPLSGGRTAVGLFNLNDSKAVIKFDWKVAGVKSGLPLEDCWMLRSAGKTGVSFVQQVPGHGAKVYIIGGKK